MGVLVGESPAGPNTPGFLGVEDLEAGSMGELCCNTRTWVFFQPATAVRSARGTGDNPPWQRQ